ncbi:MAG: cation transporter [Clostridia bacterium]|nr:cation transporter [Clostridia bacterium]MBQ6706587.1 cation transporter [Clostridia bacterium]
MTRLLIRLFIRNHDPVTAQNRPAYGKLAGNTGVIANVILFAAKLLCGLLSGSVAILADAFNNLSDAASSVMTVIGFKLSAAPPDREHPFGHGRIEYLSALAVAVFIMIAGVELAMSAIEKILSPVLPAFSPLMLIMLVAAIGVKGWLAVFYRYIGRRIDSPTLLAAFADSRNDLLCTAAVLICAVVGRVWQIAIDGYVGLLIAVFVLWSGFQMLRRTVSPLLGQAPDPKLVQGITDTVLSFDGILGLHDLIVHNYGPGRVIVSLHAEVSVNTDLATAHDLIDRAEKELQRQFRVDACIHIDPVDVEDDRFNELLLITRTVLQDVEPRLSLHDFRVVSEPGETRLLFDVTVPFDLKGEAQMLIQEVERRLKAVDDAFVPVITAEHGYL